MLARHLLANLLLFLGAFSFFLFGFVGGIAFTYVKGALAPPDPKGGGAASASILDPTWQSLISPKP